MTHHRRSRDAARRREVAELARKALMNHSRRDPEKAESIYDPNAESWVQAAINVVASQNNDPGLTTITPEYRFQGVNFPYEYGLVLLDGRGQGALQR
jgi:hypothetical protein